jgi:hypothetical protein
MPRNIAIQVLRGILENIPSLNDGEFYLATNTGQLFVGFGGVNFQVGKMATQIQDGTIPSQLAAVDAAGDVQVDVNNFPAIQPISGTVGVNNFPATQPVSGTVGISGVVATTQQGGTSGLLGDTQAKGVQGTVALMVQDFKDSGRVIKVFSASYTGTTTEALLSLTPITDGVVGTPATSFTVTSGKRFRLQSVMVTTKNAGAAGQGTEINLRTTASGAITTTSPLVGSCAAGTYLAIANVCGTAFMPIPDGLEFSGTMQFGVTQQGTATAGNTVVLVGYEY